jgi:hypothetical protein
MDHEHENVLISLAALCRAIDGTMNISEQISKLKIIMLHKPSIDGMNILEMIDNIEKMREETRANLGSVGGD